MFTLCVILTVEYFTKHSMMNGPVIIMLLGVSRVLQDKVECLEQTEVCVSMRKPERERERERDYGMLHCQGVVLSHEVVMYCIIPLNRFAVWFTDALWHCLVLRNVDVLVNYII